MEYYIPIVTVFLSGLFGLIVAVATSLLATRFDRRKERATARRRHYEDIRTLYLDVIAILEKAIRCTELGEGCGQLVSELPRINARVQLGAAQKIIDQYEIVGELLAQLSAEFRRGAPKKFGDGMVMISSHDFPHQKKAKEMYPKLNKELVQLIRLMKEHLEAIAV